MAISLGYVVYLLGSLLISPISDLFHGRDHVDLQLMSYDKTNKALQQSSKALFVFGDSLFEAGNDQYNGNGDDSDEVAAALFWPYGETFFLRPTGRYCDGRIVPDFIAKFAGLPMIPPYLQPDPKDYTHGISFASAGTGVLPTTDPIGGPMNFGVQFECFRNVTEVLQNQLGDEEAKNLLERAVYLISMGGVDYAYATYLENATDSVRQEYVQFVVGNLTMIIQRMYELGARKIAFQNVANVGCSPFMKQTYEVEIGDDGCVDWYNNLAQQHNLLLVEALKELASQLPGFKYSIFDFYHALEARMSDPKTYGFKDGENACCGYGAYRGYDCGGLNGTEAYELCSNPADFLFWDGDHNTEKANIQIAMLLWNGTGNVGPYNVQQLFDQD